MVKPFAGAELVARVAAVLRRGESLQPLRLQVDDLIVDTGAHEVRRGERRLDLRPKEYCVLHLLASRSGQVVSRGDLIEHCWDNEAEPFSNVDESVIASLRRKLGEPALIHTVRGSGYRLGKPPP